MSMDFLSGYDPTTTSLINAGIGAIGSGIASGQQQAGAQAASNVASGQQGINAGVQSPYTSTGAGAESLLGHLTGAGPDLGIGGYAGMLQPFNADTFRQYSPAYQFQQQQGMQGILNGDASSKGALSGAASKDLIDYNQNLANTSFNNAFNQYQTQQNNIYTRLAGLAQLGQNSANNLTTTGTNLAGIQAGAQAAKGGYAAQGTSGIAGALSGGLSNIQYANFLKSLGIGGTDNSSQPDTGWIGSQADNTANSIGNWNVAPVTPDYTSPSDSGTTTYFGDDGGGFKSAGGEAANTVGSSNPGINWSSGIGAAGAGLGIYNALTSGKPTGYASAGLQAANLGAQSGAFGQGGGNVQAGAQVGLNALGLYNGIKQGGVAGYAQAANSAYGLATGTGGIPGVGQALSVYNAIKGYQSGDTGGDALRGAEAGASIGSMIVPGIGTVVGGLIGGAAGAISSAFGSGKVDPENKSFESYTQAYNKAGNPQQQQAVASSNSNPYLALSGMFDLRSNQIKGSIPIYNTYGRMGEQRFTNDLVGKVQTALKSGQISPSMTPQQAYQTAVQPWINSMGSWNDSNKNAMEALLTQMTGQVMNGSYRNNWKAIGGDSPFSKG